MWCALLFLLPARLRLRLSQLRAQLYVVDASRLASAVGLGRRVNTVMQTVRC